MTSTPPWPRPRGGLPFRTRRPEPLWALQPPGVAPNFGRIPSLGAAGGPIESNGPRAWRSAAQRFAQTWVSPLFYKSLCRIGTRMGTALDKSDAAGRVCQEVGKTLVNAWRCGGVRSVDPLVLPLPVLRLGAADTKRPKLTGGDSFAWSRHPPAESKRSRSGSDLDRSSSKQFWNRPSRRDP